VQRRPDIGHGFRPEGRGDARPAVREPAVDGARETAPACPGLRLIHANDSKDGCGSHRDRHENIGAGRIGTAPFAALLHHPATRGVPFIVETPGSHAADVATLKALRQMRRPAPAPATRMR
jgi:deoxyribonuclease IV